MKHPPNNLAKPVISVILPTLNEAPHIERTLCSLLDQKRDDFELEILVIDGGSSDGTVGLVKRFIDSSTVKLLQNPERNTPAAFNIGLRAAAGEYVCILGAHSEYANNYIATCYREMLAHDAIGCSGRVLTVAANSTVSGRLSALCLGGAFASSSNSVRRQREGFADTIPYPVFRKEALLATGGYNEKLLRNQDNDMNHRLRRAGHRLYVTAKTHATYVARPDVKRLWSYGYRTGMWNAYTLSINAACMRPRHYAPFVFLISLSAFALMIFTAELAHQSIFLPLSLLTFILSGYLLFGFVAGVHTAIQERSWTALLLPLVAVGFHFAYGLGTLAGFLSLPRVTTAAAKTRRVTTLSPKYPL